MTTLRFPAFDIKVEVRGRGVVGKNIPCACGAVVFVQRPEVGVYPSTVTCDNCKQKKEN